MKRLSTLILLAIFLSGFALGADRIITSYPTGGGAPGPSVATDEMKPVTSFGVKNGSAPANPASGNVKLYSDTDGNVHILESTGTDAELMRPDVATSMSVGLEATTIHATGFMLYGPAAGGSEVETRYKQVVTVSGNAADNPDRDTIQGAIDLINWYDDATSVSRYCILIEPGTYPEQGLELPDYVDLVGVSREGCIISMASTNDDGLTAPSTALLFVPHNSTVEKLTIYNMKSPDYACAVASGCYMSGGTLQYSTTGTPRLRNCTIKSDSTFALSAIGTVDTEVEGCDVTAAMYAIQTVAKSGKVKRFSRCTATATATAGIDESPLWVGEAGTLIFEQCRLVTADATEGGVFVDEAYTDGLHLFFNHSVFTAGSANAPGPVMTGDAKAGALDVNIYLRSCSYSAEGSTDPVITWDTEDMGDGAKTFGGPVTFGGTVLIDPDLTSGPAKLLSYDGGGLTYPMFQVMRDETPDYFAADGVGLGAGTGDDPMDTFFYRSLSAAVWKSNAPIDITAALRTNGTDRITSAGVGQFAGLNTTVTQWRYFPAVACATIGSTSQANNAWNFNAYPATMIVATTDAVTGYVPVPYETGTIITRIAVRWQAAGDEDGVKLRLVKRDSTGATLTWTTCDEQATYVDSDAPYDVTTLSILDIDPDETLVAGYGYAVEIEAEKFTTGVRVADVAIETSKRAY